MSSRFLYCVGGYWQYAWVFFSSLSSLHLSHNECTSLFANAKTFLELVVFFAPLAANPMFFYTMKRETVVSYICSLFRDIHLFSWLGSSEKPPPPFALWILRWGQEVHSHVLNHNYSCYQASPQIRQILDRNVFVVLTHMLSFQK